MRVFILLFFILTTKLIWSQTKQAEVNISVRITPYFEKMTVTITSKNDSLVDYNIKIVDSKKNTIKIQNLPNAKQEIEKSILIFDLLPGNYSCLVFKEEKEIYRYDFSKDAILIEPQTAPVINTSKK